MQFRTKRNDCLFCKFNAKLYDLANVYGNVNRRMKLGGWVLIETNPRKCLAIWLNDNEEIEEGYLLSREKVLRMKGKDKIETSYSTIDKYDGIRFEGSVVNENPFGFGCLFDENGVVIYEGMVINWKRMGFGKSTDGNGKLEYVGTWCDDKQFGKGILYDSEGNTVYKGNWCDGHIVEDEYEGDGSDLNIKVKRLKLSDSCILEDFDLSLFIDLEELSIGNDCFKSVDTFVIDGLNHLKSLRIDSNSFTHLTSFNVWNGKTVNDSSRSFHVLNCAELESIDICRNSFSDFGGEFELKNLPKLYSIVIGEIETNSFNFYYSSFVVESVIES